MKLGGKRALITGGSQGFGQAIARAFCAEGASIMICARDEGRLDDARRELSGLAASKARVLAMPADVSRPVDVDRVVQATLDGLGGLDVLVCNAGVYGPKGPIHAVDWAEWTRAVEINLNGTVLPCRAALPTLLAQRSGKIIILSGGGATKPMPFLSAYAASKAAVVRWAETLAEEVRVAGIDVNTVAPGALNTRLLDEILEAGPEQVGAAFYAQSLRQKEQGGTPLDHGTALCVFLASSASDGLTGKLISAVWDPWDRLPERRAELDGSDIYTLRRIVPADRGRDWGG